MSPTAEREGSHAAPCEPRDDARQDRKHAQNTKDQVARRAGYYEAENQQNDADGNAYDRIQSHQLAGSLVPRHVLKDQTILRTPLTKEVAFVYHNARK